MNWVKDRRPGMCIINRYRKGVPLPKRLLEDCIYRIRFLKLYFQNGYTVKTFLFYPSYPSKRSVLYKLMGILKYNRTNNPRQKFARAIHWETETYRQEIPLLKDIHARQPVINYHCRDISKRFIDDVHQEIFGYRTMIDPLRFRGLCVRKSNLNALHDGQVVECPVTSVEPDTVYQILINNECEPGIVEDIRIPVFEDEIPLAYLKYKPVDNRFGSYLKFPHLNKNTEIVPPERVFSDRELELIRKFARRIGLEYGELDILRNRDDGRIYIVDANNTPTGPSHLDKQTRREVLHIMASAFQHHFLSSRPPADPPPA